MSVHVDGVGTPRTVRPSCWPAGLHRSQRSSRNLPVCCLELPGSVGYASAPETGPFRLRTKGLAGSQELRLLIADPDAAAVPAASLDLPKGVSGATAHRNRPQRQGGSHGDMAPTTLASLTATPGGAAATTAAPQVRLDRRRRGADRPVRPDRRPARLRPLDRAPLDPPPPIARHPLGWLTGPGAADHGWAAPSSPSGSAGCSPGPVPGPSPGCGSSWGCPTHQPADPAPPCR